MLVQPPLTRAFWLCVSLASCLPPYIFGLVPPSIFDFVSPGPCAPSIFGLVPPLIGFVPSIFSFAHAATAWLWFTDLAARPDLAWHIDHGQLLTCAIRIFVMIPRVESFSSNVVFSLVDCFISLFSGFNLT